MRKCESLDELPSVPYFKKPAKSNVSVVHEKEIESHAIVRSPSKQINKCISQQKNLSTLLDTGGIYGRGGRVVGKILPKRSSSLPKNK